MAKFHINSETGNIGACKALKGGCPFGGDAQHYATKDKAQQAFELSMGAQTKPLIKSHLSPASKAIAVRDEALMNALSFHGVPPLKTSQFKALLKVMENAYSRVEQLDTFIAFEALANEFGRAIVNEKSDTGISSYDHIKAAQASTLAFISPRFSNASKAFENELIANGWRSQGGEFKSLVNFDRIFAASIHQTNPLRRISLTKAFIATVQAQDYHYWRTAPPDYSELSTTDSIDAAVDKATIEINKDPKAFKEEMKRLK